MDWIGLGIGVFGDGLAIWALIQAGSAKRAVRHALEKSSDQVARDDARSLLANLTQAKDAAMGRRRGGSPLAIAGRSESNDVHRLQLAQDNLATSTISANKKLTVKLRQASTELTTALQAIASSGTRDGWADALGVLQGIIPEIEIVQRKLGIGALK